MNVPFLYSTYTQPVMFLVSERFCLQLQMHIQIVVSEVFTIWHLLRDDCGVK